jgi:hypothetical protein
VFGSRFSHLRGSREMDEAIAPIVRRAVEGSSGLCGSPIFV